MLPFKIIASISVLFVFCYSVPTGIQSDQLPLAYFNHGLNRIAAQPQPLAAPVQNGVKVEGGVGHAEAAKKEETADNSGRLVQHKELQGHHDAHAGRHGDQVHKNDYAEGSGRRKQYHDDGSTANKFIAGQEKRDFGAYAEKNDHKAGEEEVGYQYKFNKDEFKNHDEFFDNYREGGYHNTYGEAYGNYSAKEKDKKQGVTRKATSSAGKHGQKKKVDKGKKRKSHTSHKRKKGSDTKKKRVRQYGQRRGKQKNRRYRYKKKP